MKNLLLVALLLLVLASCATDYSDAASAEYLGQEIYEIYSSGNGFTSAAEVRHYANRKAFEVCRDNHKAGFVLLDRQHGADHNYILSNSSVITVNKHHSTMIIKCQGPVDPVLAVMNAKEISDDEAHRAPAAY